MLSIEHVAKEVIFMLDLTQTLYTVKSWIKTVDPLVGTGIKRKRQSKKNNYNKKPLFISNKGISTITLF